MSIVFSSSGKYFAIEYVNFKRVSSYFVRYFRGTCGVLVEEKYV